MSLTINLLKVSCRQSQIHYLSSKVKEVITASFFKTAIVFCVQTRYKYYINRKNSPVNKSSSMEENAQNYKDVSTYAIGIKLFYMLFTVNMIYQYYY